MQFRVRCLNSQTCNSWVSIPVWCNSERRRTSWDGAVAEFQFQCGAIQRSTGTQDRKLPVCFNSSVVQFRGSNIAITQAFLFVSIPVWCNSEIYNVNINSLTNWVSIPVWCNSEFSDTPIKAASNKFQFQCGAIQRITEFNASFDLGGFNSSVVQFRDRFLYSILASVSAFY